MIPCALVQWISTDQIESFLVERPSPDSMKMMKRLHGATLEGIQPNEYQSLRALCLGGERLERPEGMWQLDNDRVVIVVCQITHL